MDLLNSSSLGNFSWHWDFSSCKISFQFCIFLLIVYVHKCHTSTGMTIFFVFVYPRLIFLKKRIISKLTEISKSYSLGSNRFWLPVFFFVLRVSLNTLFRASLCPVRLTEQNLQKTYGRASREFGDGCVRWENFSISVWSSQVCHELEESGKLDNCTEVKIRFYDN